MRWQYTFDNFTEASWGSVAQSFSRDAGLENVSVGEVSVVKGLGKLFANELQLVDFGTVKEIGLEKFNSVSVKDSIAKEFSKDAGVEDIRVTEYDISKMIGKWALCILVKLCPEFTFDVFSDSKFGSQDSICRFEAVRVTDIGTVKEIELDSFDSVNLGDNVFKEFNKDVGIDNINVREASLNKMIGKWALCSLAGYNGSQDNICHFEVVRVVDASVVKKISVNFEELVNIIEVDKKEFRGHLPVYRFRVKMFPAIRYNVKHSRVSSNDGEGW